MSKLDKRAISILVIAILALSFALPLVSVSATLTDVKLSIYTGVYGDTVNAFGEAFQATSGATIEIYWDIPMGDAAYLLNSTTAKNDGSWEADFDVPEAVAGDHFVWAKDTSVPSYLNSLPFTVVALVKLSPSSGLYGDDVDVKGYGFGEEDTEKIVGIQIDPWDMIDEAVGIGALLKTVFYLDYFPVVIDSVTIFEGGIPTAIGFTLEPATGKITFDTAPAVGSIITANYKRNFYTIESSATFKTDELGSFTKTFEVPDFPYGDYYKITASDALYTDTADFTIGASISVTPEEGPTGTVVTVSGRGWTLGNTITFSTGVTPGETPVVVVGDSEVKVVSGGKFSANVVIPGGVTEGEISIWATESGTPPPPVKAPSSATFEVTGLQEIVVSPTYGSPGASISITGSNFTQIAGTEVVIELRNKESPFGWVADLVTAKTTSDGKFEETFMSPAVEFKGYDVKAVDTVYHITAVDTFKVGLIALIINPVYGEAGTKISITGIGFAPSDYNVTFGTKLYEDYSTVTGGGAISDTFYVPNFEPGTYDLTVIDIEENELTVHFTVTAVTEVILDPAKAPNDYNVTIEGYNFADKENEEVDFVLYNATDEWDMDVWQNGAGTDPVKTGIDGNFTAYWIVFPEADLSLGDYMINVTGFDDFFLQVPFSVIVARVDVAPRKALFDRGDTIQFNVKNDFKFVDSYMKIWDPYDNLYWRTEDFKSWLKVGDLYTVPYYLQTSGMNPMTLSQDAPMGTWFYVFYEEGTTQLTNGTFVVGPSSAAQVEEKLTEIWDSMEGMTENIDSITSEIEDEISALSGEMEDVVSDVQGMIDDITSDLAGELAGVAADTEAAVGELEGSIGDIAAAQNALADEVADMSEDTAAARQSAEDAQRGTEGLTTIVYGAIACSLIAALAAVVSLMQISKKIA